MDLECRHTRNGLEDRFNAIELVEVKQLALEDASPDKSIRYYAPVLVCAFEVLLPGLSAGVH